MKKSESDAKQKIMRLFESNIDNSTTMDYKPKKIHMQLKVDVLNTKVRRIKNYQLKDTL